MDRATRWQRSTQAEVCPTDGGRSSLCEGKEDELLGRLQKKLGQGQDEIRKVIASL
jgi:hypothetical protein